MPKFRIYYARKPTFRAGGSHDTPPLTLETLAETHVFVREVEAAGLEDALRNMQAEVWSPNGEAKPLIHSLGLSHTSMSVGDVAQDPFGTYWEYTGRGGWHAVE